MKFGGKTVTTSAISAAYGRFNEAADEVRRKGKRELNMPFESA